MSNEASDRKNTNDHGEIGNPVEGDLSMPESSRITSFHRRGRAIGGTLGVGDGP